jgi:predicted lipid-binding transport protein (Tim44 family)
LTGVIIFALVAAFLGFRLYSVLGKRTGHEQGFRRPEETTVPPLPGGKPAELTPDSPTVSDRTNRVAEESAMNGIRAIAGADRRFNPEEFVGGAQSAYRMILEAYWAGRIDDVSAYVSDDVREAFAEAIADREAAGEVLDNRLVNISKAIISAAEVDAGTARVTVRFDADIAAVTRDKEGAVIAGSTSDAVPTHDAWTFSRELRSSDPNWILTDTDEAA